MNDFFPSADYKLPTSSNYMKFQEGENSFRVLSSAITGYEYWNTQNKPMRSKEGWDETPDDIKREKDGGYRINHFWAFIVWNYAAEKIQILELTQKSIMRVIESYVKNPKWGSPTNYDFLITRTGSGLETDYAVTVNPKDPLDPKIAEQYSVKKINLSALYEGKDPFNE